MKHTEQVAVRWHETDAARTLRPSALLALLQETANLQFRAAGRTLDELRDREGIAFLVSRIAVDMPEPLAAYDVLTVSTFTCPPSGASFVRGFEVQKDGREVARGSSLWALVRVADRTLLRHADCLDALGITPEPEIATEMPLRFHAPRTLAWETVGERRIVWSDLDYNLHMNNTKYPDMLSDFLPDPASVRVTGFSLSYCREAAYGDTLTVSRAPGEQPGEWYFRTHHGEALCLEALLRTTPR